MTSTNWPKMSGQSFQDADPDDEGYSAKLWAVYISEAEKYDRALVEAWRSNMDGMLIYAGLFSASVTAFLTESYRNLNPDLAQTSIVLLAQISAQLAAAANGTTILELPSTPEPFVPPTTSLVCNALWFISLSLSLSCALIATLLEQWARDFLHNSDIRSAPVIRARVFSYLYYGLKRFNMHAVVEIVPLLLHASLLFFFAGLVTFLAPVNVIIMTVVATSLGVVAAVYLTLTLLPLAYLDCPYRTPFSGALWRIGHILKQLNVDNWTRGSSAADVAGRAQLPRPDRIVDAIYQQATKNCPERTARDLRALVWTVKSLTADEELESFAESISDVLWGPNGQRWTYHSHVRSLVTDPDVELWARIEGLLRSCNSGLLSSDTRTRRQIICHKALWSIATTMIPEPGHCLLPDLSLVQKSEKNNSSVEHYAVSARALIRWRWFSTVKPQIFEALTCLKKCKADLGHGRLPDLRSVSSFFEKIHQDVVFFPFLRGFVWSEHLRELKENRPADVPATTALVENILQSLRLFSTDIPFIILFDYLRECACLETLPYEFEFTRSTITPRDSCFSFAGTSHLNLVIHDVVYHHLDRVNAKAKSHFVDQIIGTLNSIWQRGHRSNPIIPRGMIEYLNRRNLDTAVSDMLDRGDATHIISAITATLNEQVSPKGFSGDLRQLVSVTEYMAALWRLFSLSPPLPHDIYQAALDAVAKCGDHHSNASIVALLKTNILKTFSFKHRNDAGATIYEIATRLANHIFPADTSFGIPADLLGRCTDGEVGNGDLDALNQVLRNRITEARVQVLSELFENCSSSVLPHNVVETLPLVAHFIPPPSSHPTHQIRFANSIRGIFNSDHHQRHPDLLKAVVNSKIFDTYAAPEECQLDSPRTPSFVQKHPWLDDRMARETIKTSFADYITTFSTKESSPLLPRIESIIHGLDFLHQRSPIFP